MKSIEEAREHIESVFLNDGFAPRGFPSAATIYRARLRGCFALTLINGAEEEVGFTARGGNDRYSDLLKWLLRLTGNGPSFWFYVCDHSAGKSRLSFVRNARLAFGGSDEITAPLNQFEIEPAPTGGGAYLGLIGEDWLLLHTHYTDQEFEISIHGQAKLCNDLCRLLAAAAHAEE